MPQQFARSEVAVIPRGKFIDCFDSSIQHVEDKVHLKCTATVPLNIKSNDHVADIRQITYTKISSDINSINKVHQHKDDSFKFDPVVQNPTLPDIDSIEVDPDNIMDEATRNKFHEVNKKFEHLFTKTPG